LDFVWKTKIIALRGIFAVKINKLFGDPKISSTRVTVKKNCPCHNIYAFTII
jgi:hypothetical protein